MSPLLIFVLVLVFIVGGLLVFRDTAGLSSPRDKKADKPDATSTANSTSTTSPDSGASCHHDHKTGCDGGNDGAGDTGGDGGSGD